MAPLLNPNTPDTAVEFTVSFVNVTDNDSDATFCRLGDQVNTILTAS